MWLARPVNPSRSSQRNVECGHVEKNQLMTIWDSLIYRVTNHWTWKLPNEKMHVPNPRGKWGLWCERNQVFREIYNLFGKAGGKRKRREMRRYVVLSFVWLPWKTENWKLKTEKYCNKIRIKFSYKIDCSLRLQTHSISFYWGWILTNSPLDYIFFLYPPCLQNFKKIKNQ